MAKAEKRAQKIANYPFMNWSKMSLALSTFLIVASLALFFMKGLNFGIDFRGGTELKIVVSENLAVVDVRQFYNERVEGDVSVTTETGAQSGQQFMKVRISADGEIAAMSEEQISMLKSELSKEFEGAETRGVNSIGGAVSGELVTKGLMAVAYTLIAIGIYIWLRFEWSFALGAIFALLHDVILTLGMFVVTGLTFDLSVVAAILAIIGYSLNDTVVVYDRIREKFQVSKTEPLGTVINGAINETLPRTIRTALTTLLAVAVLYFLGGAELAGFSLAMIWGVVVGTYSSIFIASPILTIIGVDREDKPKSTSKFSDLDI